MERLTGLDPPQTKAFTKVSEKLFKRLDPRRADPSNASRRRKREARKALSLSLPDKESVHGIRSPILSERKRKASIGLFETRILLGEKKDKKEETISTRLRVLAYLTLDWMSYFPL